MQNKVKLTNTETQTPSYSQSPLQAGRQAHTHTHARTHARTHTHTHVIYCEATHVCDVDDAREVTHVILMLLEEQG